MSSRAIDKEHHENTYPIGNPFQVKSILVPFSSFFIIQESFIYTGEENIPFQKRHPLYKSIMLNEFSEEVGSHKI